MSAPDDLAPERLMGLLSTAHYGRSLDVRATTASTMDDARAAAAGGAPNGHVVLADTQSRGRGSHGRDWQSPAGTDLYFSIVARPELSAERLPPLTLAVGLGVAAAVEAAAELDARVKWPNDVWLGGLKCAGILVETSTSGATVDCIVIGVGVNVNRGEFPDELLATATSIALARGAAVDRGAVLASMLGEIEGWVDRLVERGSMAVVAGLERRLALRGEAVRCGDVEGTLVGIAASGALMIEAGSGLVEVLAGRLERHPMVRAR